MLAEHWQKTTRKVSAERAARSQVACLSEMAVLRFTGADVENFLQGYLTSDLTRLSDGLPQLTALTNLKGRVVANGWCRLSEQNQIDWIVHVSLAEAIEAFMQRYLAFSRTKLRRLTEDHLILGLFGLEGAPVALVAEDVATVNDILSGHGVAGESDWQLACVEAKIPLVSSPVSEVFLPQMLGLVDVGAVDFDKGCYLGQEVVARAQHRGEVKRGPALLTGDTAAVPPGSTLDSSEGRVLGTVINNAAGACLAVVRLPPEPYYQAGDTRLVSVQS